MANEAAAGIEIEALEREVVAGRAEVLKELRAKYKKPVETISRSRSSGCRGVRRPASLLLCRGWR